MKEQLKQVLHTLLIELGYETVEFTIEVPKESKFGDFATNIAMQLARFYKKNPKELAHTIIEKIEEKKIAYIDHIELAGPGFLNFYMKETYLYDNLNEILTLKEQYGASDYGKGKSINIEFVSANPTGILHLGHARGAAYGDSLARLLSFIGYDVVREYYINDAGNQIVNLEKSILGRYHGLIGLEEDIPENGYHGQEIIEIAQSIYKEYGTDAKEEIFREKGLELLLNRIKNDLKSFRVSFDIWSSETSLYKTGKVAFTLESLKKSGYTYEQDQALFLKTTAFFDSKDRVLVKSDKTNTYLLPDIAYHMDKYNRGYDHYIDVLGADHHGYIDRLKSSLAIMGEDPEKLEIKILQMVRLLKNGMEVKMSKRTGNAVSMMELVEDVGLDATRYFFAMRSLDSALDFDLDLAKKQSNENPVYYVEYAYARICSILKEKNQFEPMQYQTLTSNYAKELMKKLYEFKEIVLQAAKRREPHLIPNYLYQLSSCFHTFYAHEKVLTDDEIYTKEHCNLIYATAYTIKNGLSLIGVAAHERM